MKIFIVLFAALVLFAGCGKLLTPDSLAGTVWEGSEEARYSSTSIVLSFSETDFMMKFSYTTADGTQEGTVEGTYSYIAPNLLMKHPKGNMSATVSGMSMDLESDGNHGTLYRTK